jgi:hypothetical protein
MKMVKHPNIVYLHEVMASKSKIYFAMELVRGGSLLEPLPNGSLVLDGDPHVRVLVSHLVGDVGDLDKPIDLEQGLAVGVLGLAFPSQRKADLVAGDDPIGAWSRDLWTIRCNLSRPSASCGRWSRQACPPRSISCRPRRIWPLPMVVAPPLVLKCGGRPPPVAKMGLASHLFFFNICF